jgi:hypothetical protein
VRVGHEAACRGLFLPECEKTSSQLKKQVAADEFENETNNVRYYYAKQQGYWRGGKHWLQVLFLVYVINCRPLRQARQRLAR